MTDVRTLGYGIFTWDGHERREKRYGYFSLDNTTFGDKAAVVASCDRNVLTEFLGTKVRIWCEIVESRESGHHGDHAINLFPVQPEVGEIIDLGVGILDFQVEKGFSIGVEIGLRPNDGRSDYWIDPVQFYSLHDQTVRVFIEPSNLDFSPCYRHVEALPGVFSNGDHTFQTSRIQLDPLVKLAPKITPLGGGMFAVDCNYAEGQRIEVVKQ